MPATPDPVTLDSLFPGDFEHVGSVRLKLDYCFEANPLRKSVGQCLTALGVCPAWPSTSYAWMRRHGFINGQAIYSYKGTWLVPTDSVHRSPDMLVRVRPANSH
jgi:hypothetical protein